MRSITKNDGVLIIGMGVCVGMWMCAGSAIDGAYIYDSAVWLCVLLVSVAALIYARFMPTQDIVKSPLFVAGVVVLAIVFIRQWLQLTHFDRDITEAFYSNDASLFRYATTQLVMWVCGWSYLLVATIPARSLPTLARQYWREWSIVTAIIVVAGVLRFVDLGIVPHIINGDEGLIGTWASQVMTQIGTLGLVFANMDGVGTNYLYVMGWIFQLFGQNALTVRILPALFGVLAVGTNYLFTRALFGQRTATIMAVLLTFAHVHVHFSRTVAVSYIYATALVPLVLWGLWQVVQTRQLWPAGIAALALALQINLYVDGWAWSVLVLLIIVAWLIVDRAAVIAAWRQLAVMLGLMLLGLAPMILWGVYHPADFFARLSTDGSIITGWVAREAASKGISSFQQILEMYQYAFSTFISLPFGDFYHAEVPTLDIVSAGLFLVGLVLVHNRLHTRRMLLVLGWFWGGVTALAVFTIPFSTYHYRLLVVLPVVAVPLGFVLVDLNGMVLLKNQQAQQFIPQLAVTEDCQHAMANTTFYGMGGYELSPPELPLAVALAQATVGTHDIMHELQDVRVPIRHQVVAINEGNTVNGYVLVLEDLREAYELDRLKADFVSMISHELRTPLAAIVGATSMLVNSGVTSPRDVQQDMLLLIQSQGQRLQTLIEDILNLARINRESVRLQRETIDPLTLVRRIVGQNLPTKRRVRITTKGATPMGQTLSHEQILQGVWGERYDQENQYLWVHMSHIRRKLQAANITHLAIENVRGIGYRLGYIS